MAERFIVCFSMIIFMLVDVICAQCSGGNRPLLIGSSSYNSVFQSRNYPNPYPNNELCDWNVTLPRFDTPTVVRLEFNFFSTQPNVDFLRVFDNTNVGGSLLASLSGTTPPSPIISTEPFMYIRFNSDTTISDAGFDAKVNTDPACTMGNRNIAGFGNSVLESPYYPTFYYNSAACVWNFPSDGQSKEFQFHFDPAFDIEMEGACGFDFVDIIVDDIRQGRFCNTIAPNDQTYIGFSARVVFITDSSVVHTGFRLTVGVIQMGTTAGIPTTPTPVPLTTEGTTSTTTMSAPLTTEGTTSTTTMSAISTSQPIFTPRELTISMIINGTIEASDTISGSCNTQYYNYLKQSGWNMGATVNGRLSNAEICDGDTWQLVRQEVAFSAFGNKASVKYTFHMAGHTNRSLEDNNECSFQISNHLRVHSNWEQPILPSLPGCPTTTFSPAHFDYVDNVWSCSSDPTI